MKNFKILSLFLFLFSGLCIASSYDKAPAFYVPLDSLPDSKRDIFVSYSVNGESVLQGLVDGRKKIELFHLNNIDNSMSVYSINEDSFCTVKKVVAETNNYLEKFNVNYYHNPVDCDYNKESKEVVFYGF